MSATSTTDNEEDMPSSILLPRRKIPININQSLDPLHPSNQLHYNNFLSRTTMIDNNIMLNNNENKDDGDEEDSSSTLNSIGKSVTNMDISNDTSQPSNEVHETLNYTTVKINNIDNVTNGSSSDNSESYEIAMAIYNNKFKKVTYKEYADYLGNKDNYKVLCEYIQLLKPLPLSLASVLIHLSGKLYFIAEAQNIDRILEQISKDWIAEHPDTLWETNYEIVHIILFSILILNSDLHNEHIIRSKKDKFSPQTFIENTLYAIEKQIKNHYQEIDLDDIRQQASIEFKQYYDLLKNNPLPLFNGPRRRTMSTPTRNSLNLSRNNSLRSMSHVKKMSSALSDYDEPRKSISSSNRLRTHSVNGGNTLSRSNSISSRKTTSSTFSKTTASWKYRHNQPLPQLYIKESFDENLNRLNNTMWLMDCIIKINEKDLTKVTSKKNNISSGSQSNNGTNINGSDVASISSSTSTVSAVSSSVKSHSKGIFNWLRRSKCKTMYQNSGKSMTYLDNSCRWVSARIRVAEGRIFIFRTNRSTSEKRNSSTTTNNPQVSVYSPPQSSVASKTTTSSSSSSSNKRVFSKASSTLSLPMTSYKNATNSNKDTNNKDPVYNNNSCVVLNLFECAASVVQENIITGNQSKKANFTLTFPKNLNGVQTILEFETANFQMAHLYVECLNFWAGRLSPVPVEQFEIVSNEEYGWSSRVLTGVPMTSHALNTIHLCDWKPLLTMELFYDHMDEIPGKVPLLQKIEELKSFTDKLSQLIDEHNDLKPSIINRWDKSVNFDKVMDNWNAKYLFLNEQYNKRIIYLEALEESLKTVEQRN